ncbi:hypothetical protein H6770_04205 [Candidatus Peribacteria bacterium]|nr:hypothetical protein [Candidatus Peribacteria bacterium]
MIVNFIKLSPGGNTTAIVRSVVPKESRAYVANLLMSADYVCAEQVGFLDRPISEQANVRLEMMGGELCINAIRSVSAFLLKESEENAEVLVESSGASQILKCSNNFLENGTIYTSVEWEVTPCIERLDDTTVLVELPGITHILCKKQTFPSKQDAAKIFEVLQEKYSSRLRSQPAYGIIPYSSSGESLRIRPIVYVRETESTVFETGCGSGSIALALSEAREGRTNFRIIQPSGSTYEIVITPNISSSRVVLGSIVDVLVDGKAYIPLPTI